jgi:Ribbon-helix-helix protein, copG family
MPRLATQIYLTPEQHRAVQDHARSSGRSMAEVIRELVDLHLVRGGPPPIDLSDLAGAVRTGRRTDVAVERDRMLADAMDALR